MTSDAVLRIALAALHLLALVIGLGGILTRGAALRERPSPGSIRRALRGDVGWGLAAVLWIGTGAWRYLGETEKVGAYYRHNHAFIAKMAVLALVLALEIWPMVTLIRWRIALRRGQPVEAVVSRGKAVGIAAVSHVQAVLVVTMVVLAVAVARLFGLPRA